MNFTYHCPFKPFSFHFVIVFSPELFDKVHFKQHLYCLKCLVYEECGSTSFYEFCWNGWLLSFITFCYNYSMYLFIVFDKVSKIVSKSRYLHPDLYDHWMGNLCTLILAGMFMFYALKSCKSLYPYRRFSFFWLTSAVTVMFFCVDQITKPPKSEASSSVQPPTLQPVLLLTFLSAKLCRCTLGKLYSMENGTQQ